MPATYRYEILRLVIVLCLGISLGWLIDSHCIGLVLAISGYASLHGYQLLHLYVLVLSRKRLQPPFPPGLWREIYQVLALYQQRSRKRKRNLSRFAARFRNAATSIPDALVVLDKELRVEWANNAALSLLGFAWPMVVGRPIDSLFGNSILIEYIKHGAYQQPVEIVPTHNSAMVLSIRVAPFGGKKGQRLLVARDITQLYHLNQIRRDFVANVSHELRTPLTVISGYVENLLDLPVMPDKLKHPLQRIHTQTSRMAMLIQDLLTLSKLETGEKAIHRVPIDVANMLEHAVGEVATLSINHKFEMDVNPNLWLVGNEAEIRSAFSNLVLNAVKHTRPGTTVQVDWRRNTFGPILSVRDTGDGIAAEHLPRLTERFYRVDTGRSRESGGTGLGLAIVKHILSRHDAELHISSTLGQGSTFCCQFPDNLALVAPTDEVSKRVKRAIVKYGDVGDTSIPQ